MTINFEPYIRSVELPNKTPPAPAAAAAPVNPIHDGTASYGTDIDLIRAVDPLFRNEPGSLFDFFV